ncbi:MAG: ComEA family DNA-binding protein, partial [Miltoncostaeaceae bacterium]
RQSSSGALVHVAGAVRRPGVYRLPAGARVQAAVRAAGGPTKRAFVAGLNMAAVVQDGQQVVVPRRTAGGSGGGVDGPGDTAGPISLSSATADQLQDIDGVGPTIAERIVEWRRQQGGFASVDQLLEVPGIGEGRLEALRPHVVP